MKACVVVGRKKAFPDPAAAGLLVLARESGLALDGVEVAALYELEGTFSKADALRVARELLADPVTEDAEVCAPADVPRVKGAVVVDVWLKPEVSDPVAPSVERGAADLDVTLQARAGKRYIVRGAPTAEAAVDFALRTVANPLLHRCTAHGT